ncbi:hypothetical protein R6Z07M_016496 [Ovis aries]
MRPPRNFAGQIPGPSLHPGRHSACRSTRRLRTRGRKLRPADAGAPAGGPRFAVTAGTGQKGPPYLARVPAQGCCRGSGEPRAGPGVLEVTGRGPATTWAGAGRPPSPPGARSPSAPGGRCGARGTLPAPEAEPEIRFAPPPAPFQRAEAGGWVLDPNPQRELPGNPATSQRSSRPAGTGERRARHSREADHYLKFYVLDAQVSCIRLKRSAQKAQPHTQRGRSLRGEIRTGPPRPRPRTGCLQTCTVRSLGDLLRPAEGDPHPRPHPVTEATYLTTHGRKCSGINKEGKTYVDIVILWHLVHSLSRFLHVAAK